MLANHSGKFQGTAPYSRVPISIPTRTVEKMRSKNTKHSSDPQNAARNRPKKEVSMVLAVLLIYFLRNQPVDQVIRPQEEGERRGGFFPGLCPFMIRSEKGPVLAGLGWFSEIMTNKGQNLIKLKKLIITIILNSYNFFLKNIFFSIFKAFF